MKSTRLSGSHESLLVTSPDAAAGDLRAPLPPVGTGAPLRQRVRLDLPDNAMNYSARSHLPRIEIGRTEKTGGADLNRRFSLATMESASI